MSETSLSAGIRDVLERMGFWVERLQSGKVRVHRGWMQLCSPGTPDLLIIAPVFAFVEVKVPGKKLEIEQERWHARARAAGVQVVTIDSVSAAIERGGMWLQAVECRTWDKIGLGGQ